MSVKERIKIFINYLEIPVSAFESSINSSNGYVNSISKGIGVDKILLILEKYPKLNIEWLLTGSGSMLKSESETINETINYKELADSRLEIISLQKEKIKNLESQLSELKKEYKTKDTILYVAEPGPELKK